jgi:hypothetical protein
MIFGKKRSDSGKGEAHPSQNSQPCKLRVYVDDEIVLMQDLPQYLKNDLNVWVTRDCAETALKNAAKKRKAKTDSKSSESKIPSGSKSSESKIPSKKKPGNSRNKEEELCTEQTSDEHQMEDCSTTTRIIE